MLLLVLEIDEGCEFLGEPIKKKKSEFLGIDVDPLLKFCCLIIYLEWLIIK